MAGNRTLSLRLLANTQDFSNKMKSAGNNTNKLSAKFKTMAKAGALAFAGLAAAAGAAAVKIGMDAINAASDFNETLNKTNVIFGESASSIEAWAETAAATFGQSKTQAMDAASSFATFGKAAGLTDRPLVKFSTNLTELASDLSSFYNTSPEEAITAIGAALRGESEPIRKYGVLLNDATLKAQAMKMGLYSGTGVLDQQAKVLAAYRVILKQTTDAQGDFANTSDSLANTQKTLEANMADVRVQIGQALAPAFTKFVNWLKTDGVPGIQTFLDVLGGGDGGMREEFRLNGKLVETFTDKLTPTQESFKNLAESIKKLADRFGDLFEQLEIDNPNGAFNTFVDGLATAVDALNTLTELNFGNDGFKWSDLLKSPTFKLGEFLGNRIGTQSGTMGGTNIIINGAIDPLATAKAVSNALNYAPLRGAVTNQLRPV